MFKKQIPFYFCAKGKNEILSIVIFKIIMKPINQSDDIDKTNLIKVEEDQFIEEFLPQVVCSNSNCEVIDKQGNAKGYISNKELQESLRSS